MANELSQEGPSVGSPAPSGRPGLLTFAAVLGYLIAAATFPLLRDWRVGIVNGVQMLVSSVLVATCMYGFCRMWRWAVFIYAGFCVITQLELLLIGHWHMRPFLVRALVAGIGFVYLPRMK